MNLFSRFCRWMSARHDRKAMAAVLTNDRSAYLTAAWRSDNWYRRAGGKGR